MAIAEGRRGVAIQGDALPEILLPTNCPGCGIGLETDELRSHNYVCVNCGHHFRLGADVWIQLVADKGSWHERWSDVRSHDLLNWTVPKPYQETVERLLEDGLNEALRTGTCTLAGKPIWLATFDFQFVGGTLSIVAGERLARGMEQAALSGTPYVLVSASGGARMQEGVLALMQLAKVNAAVGRLHSVGVPFFSVLTDPTFGGTAASLALLGDINIAEPGAAIGFTGPRVIKQATYADLPPGFQSAEFQLAHGQVDMVVPRTELLPGSGVLFTLKDLLVIGVTVPAMVALTLFVRYTTLGKAMRATAQNPTAAQLMGINVDRVIAATFAIGGALAGVASVVYGLYFNTVGYQMGFQNGVYAFTAAVLGGIGNVPGAVLGGLVIGLVRSLGSKYAGEEWSEALIFAILILILLFRPNGLLGARTPEKV